MPDSNVSPIEVQKYLGGVDYPIDKAALVDHAEGKGADGNVLETLRVLPMDHFNSPNDVSVAFGKRR